MARQITDQNHEFQAHIKRVTANKTHDGNMDIPMINVAGWWYGIPISKTEINAKIKTEYVTA